jgi:hypothetical protein
MKKPISIIQFRIKKDGKVFKYKKKETILIILLLLLVWINFRTIPTIYFVLTFIVISFIVVFFRPKPKFGITSEMLEKANGNGPFQYESDGFFIEIPNVGKQNVKWTGIIKIIAYRNGGIYNENFGLQVFADNDIYFVVPEMSNGCFKFYTEIKENLKLIDNFWLANISNGNDKQVVYERIV